MVLFEFLSGMWRANGDENIRGAVCRVSSSCERYVWDWLTLAMGIPTARDALAYTTREPRI